MLSILSYVSGPSVCSPWGCVCLDPLPIFFNWFFFLFLVWSYVSPLYILEIKPLSEVPLVNIFSYTVVPFSFCWCFLQPCRSFLIWNILFLIQCWLNLQMQNQGSGRPTIEKKQNKTPWTHAIKPMLFKNQLYSVGWKILIEFQNQFQIVWHRLFS